MGSGEGERSPSGGMSRSLFRIFLLTSLSSLLSSLTFGSLDWGPPVSADGKYTCRQQVDLMLRKMCKLGEWLTGARR